MVTAFFSSNGVPSSALLEFIDLNGLKWMPNGTRNFVTLF